jgi:hypothetical protein
MIARGSKRRGPLLWLTDWIRRRPFLFCVAVVNFH